ncbi:MAG: hypothetical protein JRG97_16715 [Deltaproteobacteria bacterium]|nr:hypothetical protein [Deltaproteobacteria bacterium]MBW2142669.1 hypothetical protein [Deltaproteobacteria bacterium]
MILTLNPVDRVEILTLQDNCVDLRAQGSPDIIIKGDVAALVAWRRPGGAFLCL